MTAVDVLSRARAAGLTIEPRGGTLRVRGPKPLPEDLLSELSANKPQISDALIGAERRREKVVSDAWNRLQETHLLAGQPSGWLTPDVISAEGIVQELWVSSRTDPTDAARFRSALERWETLATEAIGAAGRDPPADQR